MTSSLFNGVTTNSSSSPLLLASTKKRHACETAQRYNPTTTSQLSWLQINQTIDGKLVAIAMKGQTTTAASTHTPTDCQRSRNASHITGLGSISLCRRAARTPSSPYLSI